MVCMCSVATKVVALVRAYPAYGRTAWLPCLSGNRLVHPEALHRHSVSQTAWKGCANGIPGMRQDDVVECAVNAEA